MPLKLLRVVRTPDLSKKYAAVFVLPNGRQRTVRFGTASNYVSNPRKTKTGHRPPATTPRKSGFLLSACRRRALCGTALATILHLRSHRREEMSTGVSPRRRAA